MNLDFWNLWNSKNISKLFSRMIVFVTVLTTIIIGGTLVLHELNNFRNLETLQREKYISEQKTFIKDLVLSEKRYILLRKKSMEQDYINELKFNIEQAHELATKIYSESGNLSISDRKKMIVNYISALKSKDQFHKIFIGSKDGTGIYYPGHPEYENANLLHHTDVNGNPVVQSELDFLKKHDEGFIYYGNNNSAAKNDSTPINKVVYLKKLEPLGWYFGGKIYLEDHYSILKKDLAEKISTVRFKHSGYVFINQANGYPIVLDGKIYTGKFNFFDGSDTSRYNVFMKELKAAKSSEDGGYFSYRWNKIDETELSPKLSYACYIKDLDWLVGAGFYINDIDDQIKEQKAVLRKNFQTSIGKIIFAMTIVLLIEFLLILYFDKHYRNDFNKFFVFFRNASENYEKIDPEAFYFEEIKKTADAVNLMIDKHEEIHKKIAEEQERATNSDKLKTAFLANMSHEIRTPMNAIIGFSELLDSPESQPNRAKLVKYIRSSSNQLLKLIDDIMDISKIESNQLSIFKREFDLKELLNNIETYAKGFLDNQNSEEVNFVTEYNFPEKLKITSDEFRLRQVLLNLLGNAAKFTHEGTIKLKVSMIRDSEILFSVSDTGIGIPENEHELIFERFRQSEIVNGSKYGGTGLGLAISGNIVELLGGRIQLQSKVGVGSEFWFTIPI